MTGNHYGAHSNSVAVRGWTLQEKEAGYSNGNEPDLTHNSTAAVTHWEIGF